MIPRLSLARRWAARFKQLLHRQDGSAPVEFAIVVPTMLTIFIMAMEAGVIQLRQVMVDRALDLTVRDLRLQRIGELGEPVSQAQVADRFCEHAFLVPNCRQNLTIEMTPIDLADWVAPQTNVACVNRDLQILPVNTFTPPDSSKPTLIRTCMIVDLMFPTSRYGLNLAADSQGGFLMTSFSFFINEP